MKKQWLGGAVLLVGLLGAFTTAQATVITSTLGNSTSGLIDGTVPGALAVGAAQAGQPAPFDLGLGNDVIGPNAAGTWTHTYGAIGDPILSATLDIGIEEHDSAAAGDQVSLFSVDGNILTATLNTLFNGSGGGDGEYNVYQVDLFALGIAADLLDGTANVVLNLAGPGLQTCILAFACPGFPPATNCRQPSMGRTTSSQPCQLRPRILQRFQNPQSWFCR